MKKIGFMLLASLVIAGFIIVKGEESLGWDKSAIEIEEPRYELNQVLCDNSCTGEAIPEIDRKITRYLRQWAIKGASLAITRNDSLVYAKGYGWADEDQQIPMGPGHLLRMASVSKLVTAAAIMRLCDKGLLSLDTPVFGETGILADEPYAAVIKDRNFAKITVEHLLRHQSGFYRDPVFSSNDVRSQMQLDHAPTYEDFARLVLSHRLRYQPGTAQHYSNFGYMVLSAIIEKVTGMPYIDFISQEVMAPAGCYDFHISGNYYQDKRANEARYYTHEGDGKFISEYNGSGRMVERSYGGNNIPLLSGAGGLCASTIELARFVCSIDGRPEVPDIITPESFHAMIEYFDKATFSLGWNDTCPASGWSRTGTLSGTCALVRYFPDGECWILITNTSTWRGHTQSRLTERLFKDLRTAYSSKLPAVNLFTDGPVQEEAIIGEVSNIGN